MHLNHGAHLAYCTNVHPGETWEETLASLKTHTLAVRDRVGLGRPFAIGLRLSDQASQELVKPSTLQDFRRWLTTERCYVFTINGFPFGRFHGVRVKEQVFAPDWRFPARLAYTKRLFDILAELLPDGAEGSVSTLPGSFKGFVSNQGEIDAMVENLWRCIDHIAELSERSGHLLHLGVEPEPFGLFENTEETLAFFERMASHRPNDNRLRMHFGVNYDTCHFSIQFEEAKMSLDAFCRENIRISKMHLSSALKVNPNEPNRAALRAFSEETYLHQVVARTNDGLLLRYLDLPIALDQEEMADEWRIHFHVPLYSPPTGELETTVDQTVAALDWLETHPGHCHQLEMETYTWGVLPPVLKSASVIDQLVREYEWILPQLTGRGLR